MIDFGPTPDAYRAGVCNIGPAEIARRRRSAVVATVVMLIVATVIVVLDAPPLIRVLLFPFAAVTAINWLQVVRRFCVGFGAIGIRNFGALGGTTSVEEDAARSADRRTALRMALEGSVYGLVATGLFALLPI